MQAVNAAKRAAAAKTQVSAAAPALPRPVARRQVLLVECVEVLLDALAETTPARAGSHARFSAHARRLDNRKCTSPHACASRRAALASVIGAGLVAALGARDAALATDYKEALAR